MKKHKAYSKCKKLLKFKILALSALCFSTSCQSFAASLEGYTHFDQTLSQLPALVGFELMDAKSGQVLYAYQADKAFAPASNTKLFTATAALLALGSAATYKTTLYIKPNSLNAGNINGNLYIKFSGDPSLNSQDLSTLLLQLKKQGVHTISGNVILDDSAFTGPLFPIGSTLGDGNFCFGAPAVAINLDHNCVTANFDASAKKPRIVATSSTRVGIFSQLIWLTPSNADTCILSVNPNADNTINLSGCLPPELTSLGLAIPNPLLYAENTINDILAQLHIKVQGQIIEGTTPSLLTVFSEHQSAPLSQLLVTLLKNSDDLYASTLTKTLGYALYHQGTYKAGVLAINTELSPLKLGAYHLEDGAGTSDYNWVTPENFCTLLYAIYHSPTLSQILIPALPIAGEDGTLANFPSTLLKGKIRAKTGTLTGTANLSGYLTSASGKTLIFSLMMNGLTVSNSRARELQAQFLTQVYESQ